MQPGGIVGAAIGAFAGALIWAVLSASTGYEVGYVAWGVGGLVGFGAVLLGGRGTAMGVLCAILALVSIFAGKVLSVRFAAPAQIRKVLEAHFTQANFDALQADAAAFAACSSPDRHAEFMVAHGYTEAEEAAAVAPEELAEFRRAWVPRLQEYHAQKPSFEAWRKERLDLATEDVLSKLNLVEAVSENLGMIDLFFAFLGVSTAFKLGCGREKVQQPLNVEA